MSRPVSQLTSSICKYVVCVFTVNRFSVLLNTEVLNCWNVGVVGKFNHTDAVADTCAFYYYFIVIETCKGILENTKNLVE